MRMRREVGMSLEDDAKKIEDLAFLEFATAPDGREGEQDGFVSTIFGAEPEDERAVTQFHGEEMIDGFEVAGRFTLDDFFDMFFHPVNDFRNFGFFFDSLFQANPRR